MTNALLISLISALLVTEIFANPLKSAPATEFIILHNNDMHARFEQTGRDSGKCSPEDANTNKCYGGFARVAYEVRKYRDAAKNGGTPVLYLNAGDTYTGTPWFTVFKDNITAAFLNKLEPDAISLGNHELDENVAGLVPFLNEVNFPVLACNLDLTGAPEIATTKHFANSTILTVNDVKVGIIGYLTPDTKFLASPNAVEYKPEIDAINAEAKKLKANGVNIIIALGHSGYQKDKEIAEQCPDVDIVIGGHTNTFLYNGTQPDIERIDGPYPTMVKQKSGKKVPVVQAYAYTKYLGKLHVQFDKDGNLVKFDGSPILLNASVPRENDVLQLLELYRPNITALEQSVVGHTKVYLEGSSKVCRKRECNLGNLVADSMVHARVSENQGGLYWTDAAIAFIMGGGIRNSIEKRSDGSITETDVMSVLPFENDLYVTKVTGKTIRNALLRSATIRDRDSNGGFLQMSGIHATYDYSKDDTVNVTSVEVRCADCDVPMYEALDDTKKYNIVLPSFLLDGGDGHVFREEGVIPIRLQKNDLEALTQYLKEREFIYPEIEDRLVIIEKSSAITLISSLSIVLINLIALRLVF
ncbi:protein 5NUC-like [Teleopsis dalmanni]|uniref:protein 5NUC-like n=1 Tax=Teleopsis dalmanni TaxID=139649 RepID=UPI0018CCB34A|nr:protein 5NUC-like [Teleopsis dalmanni]